MEVSTQPNSSSFGYYGNYESGTSYVSGSYESSGCFESYGYEGDIEIYDDSEPTGYPSTASYCDEDFEECESEYSVTEPMEEVDDNCNKTEALELAASTEMLRIRFPYQSITIRLSDFCCLQDQNLLNDTIVDFYLNHIVEHILPDDPSKRVTVLPSLFWHNLSLLQNYVPDEQSISEENLQDIRFRDVLEFVEGFDLLDVDFIVVPINEWDHWSLAIICNPFKEECQIIYFDSLISYDLNGADHIYKVLNDFMKYAWQKWKRETLEMNTYLICPPSANQQRNDFDCGVYILEYARRFLLSPPKNLCCFDFRVTYPDFSVTSARSTMRKAILSLCSNRSLWNPLLEILEAGN
ncbi:unnamed protein product [Auanema sp. JU1783]|nr:unnamed protein product [Auanema sp. JU1783]